MDPAKFRNNASDSVSKYVDARLTLETLKTKKKDIKVDLDEQIKKDREYLATVMASRPEGSKRCAHFKDPSHVFETATEDDEDQGKDDEDVKVISEVTSNKKRKTATTTTTTTTATASLKKKKEKWLYLRWRKETTLTPITTELFEQAFSQLDRSHLDGAIQFTLEKDQVKFKRLRKAEKEAWKPKSSFSDHNTLDVLTKATELSIRALASKEVDRMVVIESIEKGYDVSKYPELSGQSLAAACSLNKLLKERTLLTKNEGIEEGFQEMYEEAAAIQKQEEKNLVEDYFKKFSEENQPCMKVDMTDANGTAKQGIVQMKTITTKTKPKELTITKVVPILQNTYQQTLNISPTEKFSPERYGQFLSDDFKKYMSKKIIENMNQAKQELAGSTEGSENSKNYLSFSRRAPKKNQD